MSYLGIKFDLVRKYTIHVHICPQKKTKLITFLGSISLRKICINDTKINIVTAALFLLYHSLEAFGKKSTCTSYLHYASYE